MEMVDIRTFRLENATGACAEVTNCGATLLSVVVPGKSGQPENIILGYSRLEDYLSDRFYTGSTIGRVANRIAGARFELNGKTYLLDKNDGNNSNHGGLTGFNSRLFDYQINNSQSVTFKYLSANGEGGFPGNLLLSVTYSFSDDNELLIEYEAVSDAETPFNPTCHAYFNLTGGSENILNHELKVYAGSYLETDSEYIPTGKILPVSGSAFDFRDYRKVFPKMNTCFTGYSGETDKHLATVRELSSGRSVDVYSSMPGLLVYTGDYLAEPFSPLAGIALEAQFYPDFMNRKHFPACILRPGKEMKHFIRFRFDVRNMPSQ